MTARERAERDALARMRAALLDLMQAQRFTEANELAELIERIEPPPRGEAAGSAARSGSGDGIPLPSSAPATYRATPHDCGNCGHVLAAHCTTHLLPCCPGSLMHGQDEGTWTPTSLDPA
jgi:hypothetical protein